MFLITVSEMGLCSTCSCWCDRNTVGEWKGERAHTEKEQRSLIKIQTKPERIGTYRITDKPSSGMDVKS